MSAPFMAPLLAAVVTVAPILPPDAHGLLTLRCKGHYESVFSGRQRHGAWSGRLTLDFDRQAMCLTKTDCVPITARSADSVSAGRPFDGGDNTESGFLDTERGELSWSAGSLISDFTLRAICGQARQR